MSESECETPSFNLVDEPWIRVRDVAERVRELSLLELFSEAPHLKCLSNDLPTQDFAILRVLLAILQRAISPGLDEEDIPADVWGRLWNAPELPMDEISVYLEKWHSRFDLFDEEHPFMQVTGLQTCNGKLADSRKLLADIPDGDPLFSMRFGNAADSLPYAETVRWLIHAHAFDASGIKSGVVGDPLAKGGKSYPIGVGWAGNLGGLYLEGNTLRETLLLNLILWGDQDDPDELFFADDLPIWEKSSCLAWQSETVPLGHADLYTWQSRRIRLEPTPPFVTGLVLTNGDKLAVQNMHKFEPMSAWKRSEPQEKKLGISPVYMPIRHRSDRAFWRGLSSVFAKGDDKDCSLSYPPGLITWSGYLCSKNGGNQLRPEVRLKVHAVGFEYGTQNSIVTELIDDKLTLTAFLLSPAGQSLVNLACECVDATDKAVTALRRLGANLHLASGGDKEQVAGPRDAIKARAYFEMDQAFRTWLAELGMHTNAADARFTWYRKARSIVLAIGEDMVNEAGPAAVVGSAIEYEKRKDVVWVTTARAWSWFQHDLKQALPIENNSSDTKEG